MLSLYCYIYYRKDGTTPFYVGKGVKSRVFSISKHNKWVRNIFKHDDKENIKIELIECKNEKRAFELEKRWIAIFRADGYTLCNFTDGGEGRLGLKHSQETIQKMKKPKKDTKNMKYKKSELAKINMAKAQIGRKQSEQTKEKLRKINTGKKLSEETKLKAAKAGLGRFVSEETKNKHREAQRGELGNNARLTWDIIRKIRTLYATGTPQKILCEQFKLSATHIYNIVNNNRWKE